MLNQIIELCTSSTGLYWIVLSSDVSIALAYFAIPITMAIVLRDRKDDIPYPWLWTLFVTFIVACGLTHTAHVWSAATGTDYLEAHAGIGLFCALTSVGTAIAFAFLRSNFYRRRNNNAQRSAHPMAIPLSRDEMDAVRCPLLALS